MRLPDINKQLGKHGRLLCSLHPHAPLMGSSSHKANSHSSLGLETDKARGTEQELCPSVMDTWLELQLWLEHLQPMVGAVIFGRLDLSIADLCDRVRPSYSPLPPHAGLHPCSPCLVCRQLQTRPDRAQLCLCGVRGAPRADGECWYQGGGAAVLSPHSPCGRTQSLRWLFVCAACTDGRKKAGQRWTPSKRMNAMGVISDASLRKSCKCRKCCHPPLLGKEPWDGSSATGQLSCLDTCKTHSPRHLRVFPHF